MMKSNRPLDDFDRACIKLAQHLAAAPETVKAMAAAARPYPLTTAIGSAQSAQRFVAQMRDTYPEQFTSR